jgi:hypothetical protein
MVKQKNQKNWSGRKCRCSPRKVGAESTYRNMPLNGMPEATASAVQVHGHGAIAMKSTATSMGLSISQKMDALTLTAYGINTTLDADSDLSADNPTVSRYGIGFGYDLGGGATVKGGYAAVDAMTPVAVTTAAADGVLQTHTLTSVTRNTFDLGVNFKF